MSEAGGHAPTVDFSGAGGGPVLVRLGEAPKTTTHRIRVIYTREGEPVSGADYFVKPDPGAERTGKLDGGGKLEEAELPPPPCNVRIVLDQPPAGGYLVCEDSYFVFDSSTLTPEARADLLVNRDLFNRCVDVSISRIKSMHS